MARSMFQFGFLCLGLALVQLSTAVAQEKRSSNNPTQKSTATQNGNRTGTAPATDAKSKAASGSTPKAQPTDTSSSSQGKAGKEAKEPASDGKYLLVYKLKPGQVITSEVTHLAKTDTKIDKTEQSSQSRTVSQKVWQVERVETNGNIVFVYRIESVDMSQQIGDAAEARFNSKTDTEAPSIFGRVADSIGKPLSTVTIDPRGQVVHREEGKATPNMGMGDIALIMPENPVAVGDEWSASREIRVRTPEGGQKTIKIREVHQLEKVSAGIATISIRSEPLTPISEPEVEAQVVQQLSNGTIRFDIDNGRLVSKELKWNERVVGFSGGGSMMEYTARYSEDVKSVEMKKANTASKTPAAPKTTEKR